MCQYDALPVMPLLMMRLVNPLLMMALVMPLCMTPHTLVMPLFMMRLVMPLRMTPALSCLSWGLPLSLCLFDFICEYALAFM